MITLYCSSCGQEMQESPTSAALQTCPRCGGRAFQSEKPSMFAAEPLPQEKVDITDVSSMSGEPRKTKPGTAFDFKRATFQHE